MNKASDKVSQKIVVRIFSDCQKHYLNIPVCLRYFLSNLQNGWTNKST